jgi:hypothetical protein
MAPRPRLRTGLSTQIPRVVLIHSVMLFTSHAVKIAQRPMLPSTAISAPTWKRFVCRSSPSRTPGICRRACRRTDQCAFRASRQRRVTSPSLVHGAHLSPHPPVSPAYIHVGIVLPVSLPLYHVCIDAVYSCGPCERAAPLRVRAINRRWTADLWRRPPAGVLYGRRTNRLYVVVG